MNTLYQWMLGDAILVAPVLAEDNSTTAYLPGLPAGQRWFEWGSATATHVGPVTLSLADVPLDTVPVYVRAGGVLALAPPVQYTDALPGGPLHVTVYGGADGAFTLYDDDGETTDYETAAAVSALALAWDDAAGCLTWTKTGAYPGGPQSFTQLDVTAYLPSGRTALAAAQAIGAGGRACPA
jgi:alpha-D-xyloside xylohydrolase